MWNVRREKRFMYHADKYISAFGERLKEQHGFLADPMKPLWYNVEKRLREMEVEEFVARPRNMACHNLLIKNKLPAGTNSLLGYNLNYCIQSSTATKTTKNTFIRLTEDIRRKYAFKDSPPLDEDYIPKLYIKSEYKFDHASKEIEEALCNFRRSVEEEQLQCQRRRKPQRNISHRRWELLQFLRKNDNYIVIHADKNLGPCILDRTLYINRGCLEHLANETNYQQLSEQQANNKLCYLRYQLGSFYSRFKEDLSKAEIQFLARSLRKYPTKHARFRMTAKVHKIPWMMRPIVCCAGTFMNDWSKWLDYWLQQLKPNVPTYTKDSQQILDETRLLNLSPNAKLFTCDANSMYNNIDTEHAIEVISWWLDDLHAKGKLPLGFPLEPVKVAMKMIMRNNVFEWGDLFFLQLLGTAMGTSSAVMWATLYYAYHEVHCLIPNHGHNLLYFKRFIDDIFGVWTGNVTSDWDRFCEDVNDFGILTWDITNDDHRPSNSVDFLDLTLSIVDGKIVSKTFQKKMNLFLYLPASSAHPQGCIKGTIYGLIGRYYAQNSYRKDYIYFVTTLYRHLLDRSWDREFIRRLILEATSTIESRSSATTPASSRVTDDEDNLFIHLEYHPNDIGRKKLKSLYDEHCGTLFHKEMGISEPTIAYSRPKNIGDFITQAKLHQAPGQTASILMGEYKQGLYP